MKITRTSKDKLEVEKTVIKTENYSRAELERERESVVSKRETLERRVDELKVAEKEIDDLLKELDKPYGE